MKSLFQTACLFLLLFNPLSAAWLDRKAEGWAWYETPFNEKTEEPIVLQENRPFATEELATIKKELEESLAEALLRPTKQSVLKYMETQKKWVDQSALFANQWAHLLLNNPHLDETAKFPVSQYGIQMQKQIIQEEKEQLIRQLSKKMGLFYFYRGNDKTSALFAKVVYELEKKFGFEVIAVSLDGMLLEGFKNNRIDNGISKKFNISITPSLYLVHPSSFEVIPISYGLTSIEQIQDNIFLQFSKEENEHE